MDDLYLQTIHCPYCGEPIEVQVDTSAGEQAYIEDCQVCCKPIEMRLGFFAGSWLLEAMRDDD